MKPPPIISIVMLSLVEIHARAHVNLQIKTERAAGVTVFCRESYALTPTICVRRASNVERTIRRRNQSTKGTKGR